MDLPISVNGDMVQQIIFLAIITAVAILCVWFGGEEEEEHAREHDRKRG